MSEPHKYPRRWSYMMDRLSDIFVEHPSPNDYLWHVGLDGSRSGLPGLRLDYCEALRQPTDRGGFTEFFEWPDGSWHPQKQPPPSPAGLAFVASVIRSAERKAGAA